MPDQIRTLHDAARLLEPIHAEVERILADARLLERAHHLAVADAGALVEGLLDAETEEAMDIASGWLPFWRLCDSLRDMLGAVEQGRIDAHAEALELHWPREGGR